jgi:ubiquitin C-terminal hydrolase
MQLFGFNNLGNTCYLNSVLQCFLYSKFFSGELNNDTPGIISCLNKVFNENKNFINFIDYFFTKKKDFKRFQQSDAHEFLMSFLDLLVEESPSEPYDSGLNDSWDRFLKSGKYSKFLNEYYGQTKNVIHCTKCKNVNTVFEEFCTINLDVPITQSNLISLFMKFLKKERCDDPDNLYFCDHCKSNEICEKKITITKLPKQLIIVLKRYTSTGTKIISDIDIPEVIYIKEDTVKKMVLKSSINHIGNLYDGHYTANVNMPSGWYHIDDNIIAKNDLNKNNYILFYCEEE